MRSFLAKSVAVSSILAVLCATAGGGEVTAELYSKAKVGPVYYLVIKGVIKLDKGENWDEKTSGPVERSSTLTTKRNFRT
jgi:hypothetical protein